MSFWDKLGKIIHQRVLITGRNGYEVEPTADGKIPVDATVNVDIGSVTATDVTIKDATNAAQKLKVNADGSTNVQLSGSILQERKRETIHSRQVRTANTGQITITAPKVARGAIITVYIFGVTGTFASGEGVALDVVRATGAASTIRAPRLASERVNQPLSESTLIIFPGVTGTSEFSGTTSKVKNINSVIFETVRVAVHVNGTFAGGEGIDCEAYVEWIY